jgi:hypothetical protein
MPKLLIAAVLAALASGMTGAGAAEDRAAEERGERRCTAAQIRQMERQIEQVDSVAERTKADMYLTMSKVARDNDDRRACIRHIRAVREVIER